MKKTKKFLLLLICTIGISIMLAVFLKNTALYTFYSWRLADTEQAAEKGVWTETGLVFWGPEITAQYEREKAEKTAFVESSDIAKFLYYCGYTVSGKVIRIATIAIAIVGLSFTTTLFFDTCILFHKYLRRKKRLRCRKH